MSSPDSTHKVRQKINVIDLDKTLIPFDSYRALVMERLWRGPHRAALVWQMFLRASQFSDRSQLAHGLYNILVTQMGPTKQFVGYAQSLFERIDPLVIELVNQHTEPQTVNIIVSASPEDYVRPLAEMLGWRGHGSKIQAGRFRHLYGKAKTELVRENYPECDYEYHFAISDSESDMNLMQLFRHYRLYKK